MKIGLTGSTGVLGSLLLKRIKKKHKVVTFKSDIRNYPEVKNWVKKNNFEAIFHLAAVVAVNECAKEPLKACEINVGGTYNLLEAIITLKKKPWIFFASSSHVYKLKKKPLYETDIISPRTFYGYTKWLAELIIKNFSEKYDLKFCCGRIFSFYSHKQSKDFLFRSIKNKLKSSNKISIANAHNVIDIQKAEDVVKIIIKLFNKKGQGIINIGSGKGISIKKFAKKISNNKIKVLSNTKKKNFIISNINKLNSVIN